MFKKIKRSLSFLKTAFANICKLALIFCTATSITSYAGYRHSDISQIHDILNYNDDDLEWNQLDGLTLKFNYRDEDYDPEEGTDTTNGEKYYHIIFMNYNNFRNQYTKLKQTYRYVTDSRQPSNTSDTTKTGYDWGVAFSSSDTYCYSDILGDVLLCFFPAPTSVRGYHFQYPSDNITYDITIRLASDRYYFSNGEKTRHVYLTEFNPSEGTFSYNYTDPNVWPSTHINGTFEVDKSTGDLKWSQGDGYGNLSNTEITLHRIYPGN